MAIPSFISPISLYTSYLRLRYFTANGLSPKSINVNDETTIHFWSPKKRTNKEKPSLLLIHGFGPISIWQWSSQIKSLSSIFNLYVVDLVFFGKSVTKSAERSEIFQATCVAKLMETLEVRKYFVVGTSYGGMVAYHMARLWPETVEKVVIASSGINMKRKDIEEMIRVRAKMDTNRVDDVMLPKDGTSLRVLLGLVMHSKITMLLPQFILDDLVDKLYKDNRREKQQLLQGFTFGRGDDDDDTSLVISPLQQEVLIIWGEHDQIFPLEMGKQLKEILGEKTKMVVMKKTSHVPQMESPRKFNTLVKSFLTNR